tara:strand:- start:588 stop:971 length:384 start_codon:yes stop_codon:yes gene_type:complete
MKQLLITIVAVVLVGCGPTADEMDFWTASQLGHIKVVKEHLNNGIDVNSKRNNSPNGSTALALAVAMQHYDMIEFLITNGADVNATSSMDKTVLDYASGTSKKDKQIFDLLRKHGAKTAEELKAEGK